MGPIMQTTTMIESYLPLTQEKVTLNIQSLPPNLTHNAQLVGKIYTFDTDKTQQINLKVMNGSSDSKSP